MSPLSPSRGSPEKDPNGPRASITDFYTELAEAKDTGFMDAGTQEFIHCLVPSADYDSFYSVRLKKGYWGRKHFGCEALG